MVHFFIGAFTTFCPVPSGIYLQGDCSSPRDNPSRGPVLRRSGAPPLPGTTFGRRQIYCQTVHIRSCKISGAPMPTELGTCLDHNVSLSQSLACLHCSLARLFVPSAPLRRAHFPPGPSLNPSPPPALNPKAPLPPPALYPRAPRQPPLYPQKSTIQPHMLAARGGGGRRRVGAPCGGSSYISGAHQSSIGSNIDFEAEHRHLRPRSGCRTRGTTAAGVPLRRVPPWNLVYLTSASEFHWIKYRFPINPLGGSFILRAEMTS